MPPFLFTLARRGHRSWPQHAQAWALLLAGLLLIAPRALALETQSVAAPTADAATTPTTITTHTVRGPAGGDDTATTPGASMSGAAGPVLVDSGTSRTYVIIQLNNITLADAPRQVAEIKRIVGPNPPGSNRLIGFGMVPPMLLAHSIEELRTLVNRGFDLALENDLPVYFQIDDMNSPPVVAQGPRLRYYEDPQMCEWSAFPAAGQAHGPLPALWINWGQWFSRPAIPCLAAPKLRGFARTQLRLGVLEPLAARLKELHQAGRDQLFAGIAIGWETHIPDYRPGKPLYSIDPANPPLDTHQRPPRRMQPGERVQAGYGTLHHLGYDAAKFSAAATAAGMSEQDFLVSRCHLVIQSYSALLAEATRQAGVPRERIFTHMVGIESAATVSSTMVPPIWAAVNRFSLPGFTLCQQSGAIYDLAKLTAKVEEAHDWQNEPRQHRFAVAETYVSAAPTPPAMRQFLGELFDHGAVLINFWGWGDPAGSPYAIAREGQTPLQAIIAWRAGGIAFTGTTPARSHPAASATPLPTPTAAEHRRQAPAQPFARRGGQGETP